MEDIEKVIKGLEYCQRREDGSCIGCPGDMECWCDEAIELLKKQKPMMPYNIDKVGGNCPICGLRMARGHNYCYQCGQAVKWE